MPATQSDQAAPRPPRRWRRRVIVGLVVAMIVVVAMVATGILFRKDVVQAVLEDQLAAMGLEDASFEVAHVSGDEIRIVDLRADETVRIERLTLHYAAGELLEGRLRRIEIAGLRADLTRPDEGAIAVLTRGGGADREAAQPSTLPPIPEIHIADAKLRASASGRPIDLDIDGSIGPLDGQSLPVQLKLGLETSEGRADGPLNLDVGFAGGRADDITASGDLRLNAETLALGGATLRAVKAFVPIDATIKSGALVARLAAPASIAFEQATRGEDVRIGKATATVTGHVDAKLSGPAALTAAGLGEARLRIDSGTARSIDLETLDIRVPFKFVATPDMAEVRAADGSRMSLGNARIGDTRLLDTTAALTASMKIARATETTLGRVVVIGKTDKATVGAAILENLNFDLPLDFARAAEKTSVRLSRPAVLSVGKAVTADGVRIDRGRAELWGSAALLHGQDEAVTWEGRLSGSAETIALEGARFRDAKVSLPLRLETKGDTSEFRLTAPGEISLGSARSGTLRTAGALSLKLDPRKEPLLRATPVDNAGYRMDYDVGARRARLVFRDASRKKGERAITAEFGPVAVSGRLDPTAGFAGRVRLNEAKLSTRGQRVAMSKVDVRVSTDPKGGKPVARLRIGALRRVVPASPVPPVAVAATIRPHGDLVRFTTSVSIPTAPVRVAVNGSHNLKRQSGRAAVTVTGLDFLPGGLQPQQLVPNLVGLKDVSGSIAASAKLQWSKAKVDGSARVTLQDLGAKTDAGAVDGLSGIVVFESLNPPSTRRGQKLTIRSIDIGPKVTDASFLFALLRDRTLAVEHAEMGLAGGQLRLADQKIDPFADTIQTTVEISDVELAELIGLFDIDNVSATGRLTGAIPLVITGKTVAVSDGKLATKGGGTLRIRSQQAAQVLAAGGEQVKLMLQALEDFQYQTLTIDIDKSTTGDAVVSLRTRGYNPRVLDGRPFQINVNLETNLDRVLAAVAEWYRLSGRALRDIVGGGPLGRTVSK